MKSFRLAAAFAVILPAVSGAAVAGPIQKACMASDRGGDRTLCSCIQQAADMTLSGSDQKRAVGFFKNPDKAHKTWMSKSRSDDAFWDRYKAFEAQAVAICGG